MQYVIYYHSSINGIKTLIPRYVYCKRNHLIYYVYQIKYPIVPILMTNDIF